MRFRKRAALCAALAVAVVPATSVQAQEKTGIKAGFKLAPGTAKIVLMRPSIKVGAQSTGGMFEPNADWTAQARENIARAIAAAQGQLGNSVVEYIDAEGDAAATTSEYRALFSTVAGSAITYQFFPGNRLPTKKRENSFEWALGANIGQLPGLQDADYALFITTEDHYGSTGRKIAQLFGAAAGVGISSGVHKGYAGLVDVKTGELVWLNADLAMGGDVRTEEGAAKRVSQLLEGFPGRAANPILASTYTPTAN